MQRLKIFLSCILLFFVASCALRAETEAIERPNVLWITLEDMSADLGCYGDAYAVTPRIDGLAEKSVRYTRAWSNAGMCAPARATLITGMYPPSTGAQNMRSDVRLPEFIRAFPEYLREQGYYCSNHVKTDYNWQAPETTWDAQDNNWRDQGWRRRKPTQPFFTVINITDTHSSQIYYRGEQNWKRRVAELPEEQIHAPEQASVPPYYPDTTEVRGDLARYYDNISYADGIVGRILDQLHSDGLAENTIVFLFSDHGRGMPRSKSWCFESSLRVPLLIHFPPKYEHLAPADAGQSIDRLVSFVDFAPTILSLCNVRIPEHFQGSAFLGQQATAAEDYAFAFRDRMDERYELIRAVTDGRFKYIRNYMPHRPWFHEQTRNYPRLQPTYVKWHELSRQGKLSAPASVYMTHSKPREQLFDLSRDPNELQNLANSPDHQEILQRLRDALKNWMIDSCDVGFMPESQWFTRFESTGDSRPRYTIVRQSSDSYPLTEVMATAELVGDEDSQTLEQQHFMLKSSDPAIRYWAAMGMLAQSSIRSADLQLLEQMLDDPLPSCRLVAAEALLAHSESTRPLKVILDLLTHDELYVNLLAANTLEHVAHKARPSLQRLEQIAGASRNDVDQAGGWVVKARDAIIERVIEQISADPPPWEELWDEELSQWRGYRMRSVPSGWVVDDKSITRQFAAGQEQTEFAEGGGDLITRQTFGDFEFRFEFKINEGGNSGIIYRLTEEETRSYWTGPEYQILERPDRKKNPAVHFCGSNYALDGPPEEFCHPPGEWNRGRIVARGAQIEHWLNGRRTAAYEINSYAWRNKVAESKFKEWPNYARRRQGHIALQDHGAPVAFRNLRIRALTNDIKEQ